MTENVVFSPTYSHKQMAILRDFGGETHVDEGLAELLKALWAQGYETEWSCEGGLKPGDVSTQTSYTPSMFGQFFVKGVHSTSVSDPHIVFAHYEQAVEFLKTSVERLRPVPPNYDSPAWNMALQVLPYEGRVRGNVVWAHRFTEQLTEVWKQPSSVYVPPLGYVQTLDGSKTFEVAGFETNGMETTITVGKERPHPKHTKPEFSLAVNMEDPGHVFFTPPGPHVKYNIAIEAFGGMDPEELVGKPLNTGSKRFRIAHVETTDRAVILTLGEEIT